MYHLYDKLHLEDDGSCVEMMSQMYKEITQLNITKLYVKKKLDTKIDLRRFSAVKELSVKSTMFFELSKGRNNIVGYNQTNFL